MTLTVHLFDAILLTLSGLVGYQVCQASMTIDKHDCRSVAALVFIAFVTTIFIFSIIASMFFTQGHQVIPYEWLRVLWKNVDICFLLLTSLYVKRIMRTKLPER